MVISFMAKKKTASGERFNQNAMTCASNSHKFGTHLKVTNTANDKSVICRVNDRGGFGKYGVTLDLSKGAFAKIAPLSQGRARVIIEKVDDLIAQDTQGIESSTLAQDSLSAQKKWLKRCHKLKKYQPNTPLASLWQAILQ